MKVLGAITVGVVGGLSQILASQDGVLQTIILVGGVVGAVAMIWAKGVLPAARVLRRVPGFVRKLALAVDVVLEMPGWKDDVEQRLSALEGNPQARRGMPPVKKATS